MASIPSTLIENLLWEDESNTLDFKEQQYPFSGTTENQKSEIIKDILAFANAFRRDEAYILLGVRDVKGGRGTVSGVTHHLDEADLQQLVNSKTNRTIDFHYHAIEFDQKQIGIIRIPRQERPSYLTKNYGKLHATKVYLRHGSSTGIATPEEIARMGADQPRAPRPAADPEIVALNTVHQHARFYERVARLIDDISHLPNHFIAVNPRPAEHDRERRALMSAFQQEHDRFRTAMATARDVLTARLARLPHDDDIRGVLAAIDECRTSIETYVTTANEKFAIQHTNPRAAAATAGEHLSTLVAHRLDNLGITAD